MKVNQNITYDFEKSLERLDEILDSSESFDQIEDVPNSDRLTYSNGFYFKCFAVFIDIRDSSKLPNKYKKDTLAKIYRAFISEVVAAFQEADECKEINIVGDSVWAIFSAKSKIDVQHPFHAAFTAQSIVRILNYKLCLKGINPINVGIGIDKGEALMVRAGYKGSGINDVIYMGGVVNNASKMCSLAAKKYLSNMVISEAVYQDLAGIQNRNNNYYQSFFKSEPSDVIYHGTLVNLDLEDWLNSQQLKTRCYR